MFGSGAVAQATYNALRVRPAITAAIGSPPRIYNLSAAPQSASFPLCLHYMEAGTYSGPFSDTLQTGEPTEETIRYVVRFVCETGPNSASDAPIRAAAKDALATLSAVADEVVNQGDDDFAVTFLPTGEWPLTTVIEGGVMYRQLGFFLTCHVFRV